MLCGVVAGLWYLMGPWYAGIGALILLVAFGDVAVAIYVNTRTGPPAEAGGLIGRRAVVVKAVDPNQSECTGRVRVQGELWQARLEAGQGEALLPGREVVVTGIRELCLLIRLPPG